MGWGWGRAESLSDMLVPCWCYLSGGGIQVVVQDREWLGWSVESSKDEGVSVDNSICMYILLFHICMCLSWSFIPNHSELSENTENIWGIVLKCKTNSFLCVWKHSQNSCMHLLCLAIKVLSSQSLRAKSYPPQSGNCNWIYWRKCNKYNVAIWFLYCFIECSNGQNTSFLCL